MGVSPNLGMAWGFCGGLVEVWWGFGSSNYLKQDKNNAICSSPNLGIAWGFGGFGNGI